MDQKKGPKVSEYSFSLADFFSRYYSLRNSVEFQFDESKAQRLNAGSHFFLLTPNITLCLSRLDKGGALHYFNYMNGSFMKTVTNLAIF